MKLYTKAASVYRSILGLFSVSKYALLISLFSKKTTKSNLVILENRYRKENHVALLSYLPDAFSFTREAVKYISHTNFTDNLIIAYELLRAGFSVVVVDYREKDLRQCKNIDLLIDIESNLELVDSRAKVLYMTGADPEFQNRAEDFRIESFYLKHKVYMTPRRKVNRVEEFKKSMKIADRIILLGNTWTLSTLPREYREKTSVIPVRCFQPMLMWRILYRLKCEKKEFVWMAGGGSLHKGLDLVIEYFLNNEQKVLNIVGNIEAEEDFYNFYKEKILRSENIVYHGFKTWGDIKLYKILLGCSAFIMPSCSESMSTAALSLLKMGLYPIISRETGVTLPNKSGIYIDELTEKGLSDALRDYELKANEQKKIELAEIRKIEYLHKNSFNLEWRKILSELG